MCGNVTDRSFVGTNISCSLPNNSSRFSRNMPYGTILRKSAYIYTSLEIFLNKNSLNLSVRIRGELHRIENLRQPWRSPDAHRQRYDFWVVSKTNNYNWLDNTPSIVNSLNIHSKIKPAPSSIPLRFKFKLAIGNQTINHMLCCYSCLFCWRLSTVDSENSVSSPCDS